MKRSFDIIVSFFGITLLSPLLLIVGILLKVETKGGALYTQKRVGKDGALFNIFKFRTMHINSDKEGLLTIGMNDNRITRLGYYLRKYKIDELPQLFNVFIGNMSFVGPRPEVEKYVNLYNVDQMKVLSVKPGITDLASLQYFNENELLGSSDNPEGTYINKIMPEKIELNLKYIENQNILADMKIIYLTFLRIIK